MLVKKYCGAILAALIIFQISINASVQAQVAVVPDSEPKLAEKMEKLLLRTRNRIYKTMESFEKKQEKLLLKAQTKRLTLCGYRQGDLNYDHLVNNQDVLLIQGCIGSARSPICLLADINADGLTSIGDLTVIQANMGRDPAGDCTIPAPSPTPSP